MFWKGDKIVLLGGDNYCIGMGGVVVFLVDIGVFDMGIILNVV